MRRSLARDIQITLLIKLTLLLLLWFICFKNTEKPVINTQQWMLGSETTLNPNPLAIKTH